MGKNQGSELPPDELLPLLPGQTLLEAPGNNAVNIPHSSLLAQLLLPPPSKGQGVLSTYETSFHNTRLDLEGLGWILVPWLTD